MNQNRPDNRHTNEAQNRQGSLPWWVHVIVLAAIAVVIGIAAFRLMVWNRGHEVDVSDIDEAEYDVEVSDNIFLLSSEDLAGKKEDGVQTVLFLGDDLLTFRLSEEEESLAQLIGDRLDAEVVDCGIAGTTVAQRDAVPDGSYPQDLLCFRQMAQAIATDEFEPQQRAASALGDETAMQALDRLAQVDFDALDMLIVAYDASDYLNQRIGMNPSDDEDPITYRGAMVGGLHRIRAQYPHIRIVVMSFPFCYAYGADGSVVSGYLQNFGHGRISDYWLLLYDACEQCGASFLDNLYGTINESESDQYLVDIVRVNEKCRRAIADHLARALKEGGQ